jgi:hypothetical protein
MYTFREIFEGRVLSGRLVFQCCSRCHQSLPFCFVNSPVFSRNITECILEGARPCAEVNSH